MKNKKIKIVIIVILLVGLISILQKPLSRGACKTLGNPQWCADAKIWDCHSGWGYHCHTYYDYEHIH